MVHYTISVATMNGRPLENGTPCEVTMEFNFEASANKAKEKQELKKQYGEHLIIQGDLGIMRYETEYTDEIKNIINGIQGKRTETLEGGEQKTRFTNSESFLDHYGKD